MGIYPRFRHSKHVPAKRAIERCGHVVSTFGFRNKYCKNAKSNKQNKGDSNTTRRSSAKSAAETRLISSLKLQPDLRMNHHPHACFGERRQLHGAGQGITQILHFRNFAIYHEYFGSKLMWR